jgi:hypothetical protein
MMQSRRGLLLAAACALLLPSASRARAQDDRPGKSVDAAGGAEHSADPELEKRKKLVMAADLVIGFGGYAALAPTRGTAPGFLSTGSAAVSNASLIVSAGYELGRHLGLGLRLPLSAGGAAPCTR